MIDPNSQETLISVATEVGRLLEQYGVIETEPIDDDGGYVMEEDMYAIYEDFVCCILDSIQKLEKQ